NIFLVEVIDVLLLIVAWPACRGLYIRCRRWPRDLDIARLAEKLRPAQWITGPTGAQPRKSRRIGVRRSSDAQYSSVSRSISASSGAGAWRTSWRMAAVRPFWTGMP